MQQLKKRNRNPTIAINPITHELLRQYASLQKKRVHQVTDEIIKVFFTNNPMIVETKNNGSSLETLQLKVDRLEEHLAILMS